MSDPIPQPLEPDGVSQGVQATLLLGMSKQRRPLSSIPSRSKLLKKVTPQYQAPRPSHDLSTAQVISLIEKRLKWIDRCDLQVGLMNYYDDNHYMIELVGADRSAVYHVYVDATDAQFYWIDVSA